MTLIQRFGSALNLNMHLHMLFLDGAYRFAGGKASFYRARRSTRDELARLLDALSLHAATVCEAHQRSKLERLCRYITAARRLSVDDRDRVI